MFLRKELNVKRLVLFVVFLCFGTWCEAAEYVAETDIPAEIKGFVEQGTRVLAVKSADLNGDGLSDYLIVLQKQGKDADGQPLEEGQRPLIILLRRADGTLTVAKRNDRIVMCETCGGMLGDPFVGIEAGGRTFTVSHYGGSAWRWTNSYRFNYSRIDKTWQLVRVELSEFHTSKPQKKKREVYTPPRDFGKIDIVDFDPDNFLYKSKK